MRWLYVVALMCLAAVSSFGDTVNFHGGGTLKCQVIQDTAKQVTVISGASLLTFDRVLVRSVTKDAPADVNGTTKPERLPTWSRFISAAAAKSWAKDIRQIAAVVVEVGPLANVPYKSFQAGDYEINVYGDPAAPAGIEVGVYGPGATDRLAQDNCMSLLAELLRDQGDIDELRGLKRDGQAVLREELTLEVTPPSAPDAFGGWWVSLYFEKEIDKARAKQSELEAITVDVAAAKRQAAESRLAVSKRVAQPSSTKQRGKDDELDSLQLEQAGSQYATGRRQAASASTKKTVGDRVYVSGYYRKDGTYVSPHTRSRPHR